MYRRARLGVMTLICMAGVSAGSAVADDKLVLPTNGGNRESSTSEYGVGWGVAQRTDGIIEHDG